MVTFLLKLAGSRANREGEAIYRNKGGHAELENGSMPLLHNGRRLGNRLIPGLRSGQLVDCEPGDAFRGKRTRDLKVQVAKV